MKTYLFAVQLLLISLKVVGQPLSDGKCDYIWKTGYDGYAADSNFKHMTLNFNTLPFTINTTTDTASFLAMSAIISDSLGNLVCYTNGAFLYDRNNVKMRLDTLNPGYYARGSDPTLLCYNFPQTAVILAKPNNPNEYYLFHERIAAPIPTFNGSLGEDFFYTVVDARLRNGLGGVASWRNLIVRDTLEQCKINARQPSSIHRLSSSYSVDPISNRVPPR